MILPYNFQTELKHTVEHLHEEQERIVKIEAVKKSLEIEVKVSWRIPLSRRFK